MKVIILGSGIIGVTTAYFLAKSGVQVTILEKNNDSANGCSYANGGQLSFSYVQPWSCTSSLFSIFKAAINSSFSRNSFLSFDKKSINKEFLKWAGAFIANSTQNKKITEKLLNIGNYSKNNLSNILQEEQINFHHKQEGILHFYRSNTSFQKALKQTKLQKSMGYNLEILTNKDCLRKEPALVKLFDHNKLAGGILFKDDASGNSSDFTKNLAKICKNKLGVTFKYNTQIKNIFSNYKKITGINTSEGVFTADNYVCALGSYAHSLLDGIGINLKIYPIKGYSLSILTNEKKLSSPNLSIADSENKIVYSKLGNIFRAAGTIEICNLKTAHNPRNITFLKNIIKSTYSNFGDLETAQEWSGFRPHRPDCLPIVCKTKKYSNFFINSGHGSLGWTMSFATSKIISDIILENKIDANFTFLEKMEKNIYKN